MTQANAETTATTDNAASSAGNWKTRTYMLGVVVGALMGFLSAYLYAREAESNSENGERPELPPTALIGLALSVLSLVRQIAEAGRKKKK